MLRVFSSVQSGRFINISTFVCEDENHLPKISEIGFSRFKILNVFNKIKMSFSKSFTSEVVRGVLLERISPKVFFFCLEIIYLLLGKKWAFQLMRFSTYIPVMVKKSFSMNSRIELLTMLLKMLYFDYM